MAGRRASLSRQASMLPESQEQTMCMSQELEEREPAGGENDGSADKAMLSSASPYPTYTEVGWDSEFLLPEKTGVRFISERSHSELSIARVMESNQRGRHQPDRSKPREPEFESAVERIIMGI